MINVNRIEEKFLYTTSETADFLELKESTVARYVRQKKIKSRKVGRLVYIEGVDILDWLDTNKEEDK